MKTVPEQPVLTTVATEAAASKADVPVRRDMTGKTVHPEAASTTATTMDSVWTVHVSVRRATLETTVQEVRTKAITEILFFYMTALK